jgi:5-methylcytosine-specific restriction endonuclease McrA
MGVYAGFRHPERRKEYNRNYTREYKRKRREKYLDGKACTWCGSAENLEFHHVNPAEKEDHHIWCWSTERLERELAKCIILCRECHQGYHAEKNQLSKEEERTIAANVTGNLDALFG